jgi:glycosyltransferase involved in cell wall biosynthesis
VQDLWPESLSATGAVRSRFILKTVEKMVRFIYRACDRILVTSQAFVPSIVKLGGDAGRISYFPQSAEVLYKPVTTIKDNPAPADVPAGFRVIFAGNIGTAQAFENILAAAELLTEHQDINWVIIGDGRMRSWVEKQVQERKLVKTVHLMGRHPVEAMPRFFSLADALLVTLKRDPIFSMTIPAKVQSYLACGKPIIAALDGEGARLIAESGAGLSCPAEDPEALARAVLTMYQMPEIARDNMGRSGKAYYAAYFDRGMLLDRLEGWMQQLINNH